MFADYLGLLPHRCQIFTTLASKNEHMSTLNESKNYKLKLYSYLICC